MKWEVFFAVLVPIDLPHYYCRQNMKRALHILAGLIVVIGVGLWFQAGQNQGWTKTSKATERVEPVTGLVEQVYEKGFYPGVDFLAATGLVSVGLFGASFLIRKKI